MTSTFNSPNYLFILVNPGSGGHRLGRIISCISNVYWYSHNKNGIHPWDVFFTDKVSGKNISQYHYDRLVGDDSIPLLGERIERWWNTEDYNIFYNEVWSKRIVKFQSILDNRYIHWVLHDLPNDLLIRFPNAKIISLIDTDIEAVVNRHLVTTSNFPCYYQHQNLKPTYLTEHAKIATALSKIKTNATEKDLWIFKNCITSNDYELDYKLSVYNKVLNDNNIRNMFEDPRHKKITWESLDIAQVIDFLNATNIDDNYKKLLN
jgi:hypothetical protein